MLVKKWLYAIISVFFFLSFISTTKAAPDGIELKDYQDRAHLVMAINNEAVNRLMGETILLPRASFNAEQAAGIINTLARLPEPLLLKIHNAGIVVRLFDGKLTDNPSARHLKGVTPRGYSNGTTWDAVPGIGGSKIVLVKIGSSGKGNGHGSVNLELHELAHSVDRLIYDSFSQKDSFKAIWEKERSILFPRQDYFLLYPEEYFAEAFALYYYSSETNAYLEKNAPSTYHILKGLD
nr:hypothetical protein [uncultured bacterium]